MFWQDLHSQLQNCINAIGAESWKPIAGDKIIELTQAEKGVYGNFWTFCKEYFII